MTAPLIYRWVVLTWAGMQVGCRLEPVSSGTGAPVVVDSGRPPPPALTSPDGQPDLVPAMPDGGSVSSPAPDPTPDAPAADSRLDPPSSDLRPDLRPDLPDSRPPPPPGPPTAGLVGHWPFDEGSGTGAADVTGNGSNATLHNGVAWERSRVSRGPDDFAVRLDGENDYLSAVAGSRLPDIDGPKTIAVWLEIDPDAPPSSGVTGQRTCIALASPEMVSSIQLGIDRNRPGAWSWAENQAFVIAPAPPSPGAHHLAYTFDRTTHRFYLDGREVDSSTTTPQRGRASVLYIGTYTPPNAPLRRPDRRPAHL